jgi:transcriptional regulator with XRE-family HTH domain
MKYDKRKPTARNCRETRALLGYRFKILLADAGLTAEAAAELLHVTPCTIRYWISGKVTVPYAAYRLVRVMRLFELPCEGWDGWHMHSGKLWSPEGFGFLPADSSWWNGLVRKANLFHQLYDRDRQLDIALQRMRTGDGAAGTAQTAAAPARRLDGQAAPSPTAQRSGGEADRPNL